MLLVLNAMVDRFLALREPLEERLDHWETSLLDPDDPFNDWMTLIRHRNEFRRLERLCNEQVDALTDWREGGTVELDDSLSVRTNDVVEHVERVLGQAQHLQAQLESLVQIHFAATAHRTNEIMRVLTIVAAVFLPLSLIAGIFGMNFDYMPELKLRYAYPCALAFMLLVGGGMLYYFRRRNWL
jgi:magnesium/cobalt transport protein CorA